MSGASEGSGGSGASGGRFGPDPQAFFADVYRQPAPWDVGAAQPALAAQLEAYPPAGAALDVGCGTGDLAIWLARRGLDVLGVDFVAAAVDEARARAAALPGDAAGRLAFEVGDALRPSALGAAVGAVLDSGFLHLFDHAQRDRFVDDLARALAPGGRYYLLAFAVTFPAEHVPLQVDAEEVHARFPAAAGWRVLACEPAEFLSRVGPVPALRACVERA
ncbi:class I SAM-dependent methyltransferase [Roseisolibacter sp. H3M3-2]|uniref:class I SAM-dependent methyltransferase n=1 Tax=Roseisolibacter sp. H3M3-2 TaxID=3031323 RepID=UPI0023DB50D2|nr:class I SAM-dependent methyltransferase [Roseisolibacter sp. H3M3-2]MDF1503754.1 class I SAM-dependent methyltransferase [Roseisolibacter sp. H3M3-2]